MLVIDDTPATVEYLVQSLAAEGYRVVTAQSGGEGIAQALAQRPDLVLLDAMMPGMDGFEVCRRLRAEADLEHLPIIMLTALDSGEARLQSYAAGANDFVSKPVDRAELLARVRTIARLDWFRRFAAERHKVAQLVRLAPDGLVVVRATGLISVANPAMAELAGVGGPEELVHRPAADLVPPEERGRWSVAMQEVLGGLATRLLVPGHLVRQDGTRVPIEVSAVKLQWDGVPGWLLQVRDVSDRQRLEEDLRRTQRLEALGRLAGGVAHDFSNYLSAIRNTAMLLQADLPPGSRSADDAAALLRFVEDAQGLTRNLLAFARREDLSPVKVDLNAVLRDWGPMLSQLVDGKGRLLMDLCPGALPVLGDASRLQQAVVNLVVNASEAIGAGGTIRVSTASRRRAGGRGDAELVVQDDGPGIPAADLPRLFEPFFTRKTGGTGFGLPIVHSVVTQSGGTIDVRSEPGAGTTFRIRLPLLDTGPR